MKNEDKIKKKQIELRRGYASTRGRGYKKIPGLCPPPLWRYKVTSSMKHIERDKTIDKEKERRTEEEM